MSFVTTVPDLIETAAGDLAGIRSSLGAATAAAAPSTTGVATAAADEVSVAIAALFDTHGQQFQTLSAQAEAFHSEFVRLLNSAAASYASTEANVRLGLLSAVSGSTRATGAAFGAIAASGTGDIAGPYQQLFANTSANLQALGSELQANPTPLLRQFLANQRGYAQTIAAEIQSAIQGFPGNVRPAIQAFIQSLENFDLAAFLQTVVQHQIGYAQTIGTALQNAAMDFGTGTAGAARELPIGLPGLADGRRLWGGERHHERLRESLLHRHRRPNHGSDHGHRRDPYARGNRGLPAAHTQRACRNGAELHQLSAPGFHTCANLPELHERSRHRPGHFLGCQRRDRHQDHSTLRSVLRPRSSPECR